MNDNIGTIAEAVTRLSVKVDQLMDSLPQRYISRTDFDPWRGSVESRLVGLEKGHADIKDNISRRAEEGARWTIQTLKEIDQKIDSRHQTLLDKLDHLEEATETKAEERRQQDFSKRAVVVSILFGAVGSAIAIIEFLGHFHP